ncbi:hypothetical protein [Methylorubrum extorquens]|uniref:hypothetical protein n=1 Tax=Methylorubrum extorquens TaxID=408 RepID=UPI0013018CCE|nr:hypothetical protein [Methylorubrum extorquens]MCP1544551.1 hypothetical protein [Methylorubrum extorquens]MCP1588102.1 hypothetical protein [Methylorubrum extorquens]
MNDIERRVATLEEGAKEIRALLKEIRDGQHAAALKAAEQAGAASTKFAEIGTQFAGVDAKLVGITETGVGLRRDLEKLPSEFGVAKIMVFVVGGLGVTALLIKNAWPLLSRLFS